MYYTNSKMYSFSISDTLQIRGKYSININITKALIRNVLISSNKYTNRTFPTIIEHQIRKAHQLFTAIEEHQSCTPYNIPE